MNSQDYSSSDVTLADALAHANRPGVSEEALPKDHVYIAGATGRFGQAVVQATLASLRTQRVSVWGKGPVQSVTDKFQVVQEVPAQVDVAIFVLSDPANQQPTQENVRSGAQELLHSLNSDQLLSQAQACAAAGAHSVLLASPQRAFIDPAYARSLIMNPLEQALVSMSFSRMFVLRPSLVNQAGTSGSVLQRFAQWYMRQFNYLNIDRQFVLDSNNLAKAASSVLFDRTASGHLRFGPGTHVLDAQALAKVLVPTASKTQKE